MRWDFPDPFGPTNERKTRSFVEISFGEGKIYPTVLDKMAIKTVVSSQVSDNVILTIQQAKINSMTKNWDKKTTKDRLQVCPKHFQD